MTTRRNVIVAPGALAATPLLEQERLERRIVFLGAGTVATSATYLGVSPLADLAPQYRIPGILAASTSVQAGGLLSYGPSNDDYFRRAAGYVDKILKGAKPGDLPIEQPIKFEMVINRKTAKAMGIVLPQSILLRADLVID